MLSIGRETPGNPPPADSFPRIHQPHESVLSPSIQRAPGETIPAYELKFLIPETAAQAVERWADEHLQRDAFADLAHGGSYQTTTLYLDTPGLDVFYRTSGFRGRKFRLRRYGHEQQIYLERKSRHGDRVKKKRCDVPLADLNVLPHDGAALDWPGLWFRERVVAQSLRPVCLITYQRTAFVKPTSAGPLRVTLDRQIRGVPTSDWDLPPVDAGHGILAGQVICEFKFREALPNLFKEVIAGQQLQPGSISKYRRVMTAAGVVCDGTSDQGRGQNA